MKKFLLALSALALVGLWASPAFAVNAPICVTVVFFDINGAPPLSDLVIVSVKTAEIEKLKAHRGRPLLTIYIMRGPIGTRNSSTFTGHEEYGISKSGANDEDVYIGQHDRTPGQVYGIQWTLHESTFQYNVTVPDASAYRVVEETDSTVLISLDTSSPFYPDAQARSAELPFSLTDTCLL